MRNLEDVKEGDVLILRNCGWGVSLRKMVVTKVTKTQIVCGDTRYNKRTGYEVGSDSYSRSYIDLPREGDWVKLDMQLATYKLQKVKVTEDNAKQILEFLKTLEGGTNNA